jgi:hypothetical protein
MARIQFQICGGKLAVKAAKKRHQPPQKIMLKFLSY